MSVHGRVARSQVEPQARGRIHGTVLAYLALTKPRVIELLLVTAIPAMLLAHRGAVHPILIANTLVGGMLAAVATERQVTRQILVYTWLTVLASLALALAAGWLYAAVAVVAGAWFLTMAHQLDAAVRAGEPVKPLRLFLQSNNYLALVFCALAVDSAINLPTLF